MSRLEDISIEYRKKQVNKNIYNKNNEFNSGHPNALSDGDVKGKGENDGSIGSSEDIKLRKQTLVRNTYSPNNEYNDSNA